MSESDDIFRTGNPFPSSPVVQLRVLSDRGQAGAVPFAPPVNVDTDAVQQLREQVDDYLDHTETRPGRGRVVALIGDLGLGKSHMAREVVTAVHSRNSAIPVWVIDQPALDLGRIYRNQLTTLQDDRNARSAFESVVAGYHAYVTADVMEGDTSGRLPDRTRQEFVRQLRQRDLDSQKVVQHFGIDEELIHRHLRTQLRGITDHRKFAVALALLLDRRFNREVWDWLGGNPPAPSLVQRGITAPIDGTDGVFDALAVYGFVHGQVGQPYALVLDALEDVLEWPTRDRTSFVNGFEALVNTYGNQGGLLVVCIQPEPWSRLPPGLHERVLQIWPDRMDETATRKLVGGYVRRPPQQPGNVDAVFTRPGIKELTELSNGVPRQILKICRRAWRLMETPQRTRTRIDPSVIHEAVRELHEQRPMSDVHQEIERVLAGDQWHRETEPDEIAALHGPDMRKVAYWVRVGANAAIAIMVVPSILLGSQVDDIAVVARAARNAFADGDCRTLVLVNGLVSRAMRDAVARETGTTLLVVAEPGFHGLLRRAVTLLAERLGTVGQGGAPADVRERLESMSAAQAALLEYVREVNARLAGGAAPVPRRAAPPGWDDLPDTLLAHFRSASKALEVLAEPPAGLRQALGVDETGLALAGEHSRRLGFSPGQIRAMGLASAAGALLDAFRSGVADWLRAVAADPDGPTEEQRHGLFVICRSFEITMEVLPPLEPSDPRGAGPAPARSAPPRPGPGQAAAEADLRERAAHARRLTEARETLSRLAESVQYAALQAVTGREEAGAEW